MLSFLHGRVAVLDGGYPAWAARGLPKEIDSVPAEDIASPGRAVQSPPEDVKYRAVLQACFAPQHLVYRPSDGGRAHMLVCWLMRHVSRAMVAISGCPETARILWKLR